MGVAFGQGSAREVFDAQNDPPAIVHWARGHAPEFASKGGAGFGKPVSLLTSHGGPILATTAVHAIFWGGSWSSPGDKISGIDTFYAGVGGTNYAGTNTEYTDLSGHVGTTISYSGHDI